jgi:transcription elongation factor Elf1
MTPFAKEYRQRRVVGTCAGCGGMPEFIVTKYYEGLQRIEKYCDKCLEQKENRTRENEEIKSKVQVVESVSELTRNHPWPTDQ